jgi:hypothetical protein
MVGYIHIFRNELATGTYGSSATQYQLTYTSSGHSWAATFDEGRLEDFLAEIGIPRISAAEAVNRARLQGNTTIADVTVHESELSAMGLQQMPTDY